MPSLGKIGDFLRLIRWKNVVMIILTMVLIRYALIAPLVSQISVVLTSNLGDPVALSLKLPWYRFAILVAATASIAAGGYIINDYFDIRTDIANKREVIIGNSISRNRAILWHSVLNILGVSAGFYVSHKAGYFGFGIIFLLVSGLLYFYSASYKRQFLIGNLIVALLTALVPIITGFFEWSAIYSYCSAYAVTIPNFDFLFYWVGCFALFAFMTNFTREIVKDIEDYDGDIAFGRNTMPIVLGIKCTKFVVAALLFITVLGLYFIWFTFIHDVITLCYLTITIAIPLLFACLTLFKEVEKKSIRLTSRIIKVVMVTGILYCVVVKFILSSNLL